MANRRSGGMSGGFRGNRSFSQHQPFQGNPWQGPNSMNQGLISNPQQLALALSNLLQPQQQMNNPPSLLSLNTSPGYSDQDRNFNRFGNRGRDLRRHEPYSKNRGGWRDRNRGQRNQNRKKNDQKKEKNDKDENEEKKGGVEGETEGVEGEKVGEEKTNGEENEAKEGIYHGVPKKYLNCFVCNKDMWDGESMQKHVRGRAHRQMLDTLEESIHLTVNILREHLRLSEEKKVIEFNRMQRVTKKFPRGHEPENHCNMCDLKFMGKIVAHRKTEGHQRLKRYLHPKCTTCDKEFPSRVEWVEHRLTPEHLRKLAETLKDKNEDEDGDIIIEEGEPDLEPILEESLQLESEFPLFELTDDLSGLQNLIPAYKPDRPVSKQSLKEFSGFRCELCHRSFENEELAQKHLKSKLHYYTFIGAAKNKYKDIVAKKEREEKERLAKEKREQEKQNAENGDVEMEGADGEKKNENDESEAKDEDTDNPVEENADNTVEDVEMLEEEEQDIKQEIQEEATQEVKEIIKEVKTEVKVEPPSPARQTRNTGAAAMPAKNGTSPVVSKAKRGRK